ncbi:MAG: xanthine phosphoribosyltransferase [Agathobacter sp.]|nr:xanthine phosphoribosyltransferase [Agathobacter sp.]
MKKLINYILAEGEIVNENILKVDGFINHQINPVLMKEIGEEFAKHFKDKGITKILTIESSGIAPALMTSLSMDLPLVILKKEPPKELNDNFYQTQVTSYATDRSYDLTLCAKYITPDDHVLIIDDFLAHGEAMTGAIRLIRQAHATVGGIGILIEKSFQPGHTKLREQGLDVYSLARIKSMEPGEITFIEE